MQIRCFGSGLYTALAEFPAGIQAGAKREQAAQTQHEHHGFKNGSAEDADGGLLLVGVVRKVWDGLSFTTRKISGE